MWSCIEESLQKCMWDSTQCKPIEKWT